MVGTVTNTKKIIVVGNGIAAKCVVYFLNRRGFNNITLIADDKKAPSCSVRSTSTNCLRGTESGVSDLGDLILKSYRDFELFFSENSPDGVSKSIETHTTPVETKKLDRWRRRYSKFDTKSQFEYFTSTFNQKFHSVDNEAYFIFPEILFDWFDRSLSYNFVEGFVTKVGEKEIETDSNERLEFDTLVLCTSYLTKDFSDIVREDIQIPLEKSKPVPGTYLSFPIALFDCAKIELTRDYCFRIDDIHLLVRPTAGDVLIGSTSKSNVLDHSHDLEAMKEMYDRFSSYLEGVLSLPDFDDGQLITGIRHKGRARRPFWGKVNNDIYAVWGLYKNAFTFAFTAGEEIADLIDR